MILAGLKTGDVQIVKPQYFCPRCGLEGNHLKSADPLRCRQCCAADAAPKLLAVCKRIIFEVIDGSEIEFWANDELCSAVKAAVAEAEGRIP